MDQPRDWVSTVLTSAGIAGSPVMVYVLRLNSQMALRPLAVWSEEYNLPVDGMVVFGAIVGATISIFFPPGNVSNVKKIITLNVAFFSVILGMWVYSVFFFDNPPDEASLWFYDIASISLFFLIVHPGQGYCICLTYLWFVAKMKGRKARQPSTRGRRDESSVQSINDATGTSEMDSESATEPNTESSG